MGLPITAAQWEERLRAYPPIELTEAEVPGCARLMAAYMEGSRWLTDRLGPERSAPVTGFVPSIVAAVPPGTPEIATRNDGTDVTILSAALRHWARKAPDEPVEVRSRTGEFLYAATPIDYFRLAGVEETHHLLSIRERSLRVGAGPRQVRTTFDYHAKDLEFAALEQKIIFADERHLPLSVRLQLRMLHQGALKVREELGLDRRTAAPAKGLVLG